MANVELIREIVRTYELPPKLEARVITMSINYISSLGLNGYDGIYREIANLVEKCLEPIPIGLNNSFSLF